MEVGGGGGGGGVGGGWGGGGGGGVATFFITLQFNRIYCVCGKSKVSFITFWFFSLFGLVMQDYHPSLYRTKSLFRLYISHPFW